ncbi:hypothetical protein VTL71DRAFT_13683 [Oculimacula yallundae]|uniref:Uncharacterized protein n=1 Tax=Oculimacula yallundae TaxID=86028 RepID=A0ABR4CL40_9HELO
MAGIARKDVEILVHTTAPSRGQDDAKYRRIAEAYLSFQPATRTEFEYDLPNNAPENLDEAAGSQLQEELHQAAQETQREPESGASYHPDRDSSDEEDVYKYVIEHPLSLSQELLSPSMSFNSAADNANSPIFRAQVTHYGDLPGLDSSQELGITESWVAPPSEVPDSQPEVSRAMIAFSSPTRMLELYLQNQESQLTRSTPDKSPDKSDKTSSLDLPSGLKGLLSSSPDHGLTQSSPSPVRGPERQPERILEARRSIPPSTQDPALSLKRKWVSSSSEGTHPSSAPPKPILPIIEAPMSSQPLPPRPEKRARLEPPSIRALASSQPTPTSSRLACTPTPSSFQAPGNWWSQLEIRPRPPATSNEELTAEKFITPHLAALAKRLPSGIYCPLFQKRDLRGMERGYWSVDCRNWTEDLQQQCWNTLGSSIGKNNSGWGVWCVRDENCTYIRVYCWGIVAEHIYLLLYMASNNKIKKAGARWIGGNGETIIQMS